MTDSDIAAVREALVDIPMTVEAGDEWIIDGHAALARVEARLEAAEKALKVNTPCCKGDCAPLHWCEQCMAISNARRALAGKDAAA